MKKTYDWKLVVWRKPLFGGDWEDEHKVKGTEEDFKKIFQLLYGKDESLFQRVMDEKKVTLGKGTYGFTLSLELLSLFEAFCLFFVFTATFFLATLACLTFKVQLIVS